MVMGVESRDSNIRAWWQRHPSHGCKNSQKSWEGLVPSKWWLGSCPHSGLTDSESQVIPGRRYSSCGCKKVRTIHVQLKAGVWINVRGQQGREQGHGRQRWEGVDAAHWATHRTWRVAHRDAHCLGQSHHGLNYKLHCICVNTVFSPMQF